MTVQKYLEDSAAIDGTKLWDMILKTIVAGMPSQLLPLFKEVYGREYPKDAQITVLGSETTSFWENTASPLSSTLMDIALLVNGTDYYHLECQRNRDSDVCLRCAFCYYSYENRGWKYRGDYTVFSAFRGNLSGAE